MTLSTAMQTFYNGNMVLLIPLLIWGMAWQGIGMWKSAKENKMWWFVSILIFSTWGLLPIIYLAFFQNKKSNKLKKISRPIAKKKVSKVKKRKR